MRWRDSDEIRRLAGVFFESSSERCLPRGLEGFEGSTGAVRIRFSR